MEAFLKAKHSAIQIKNTDELCCAQAIVTMKACLHKGENVDGRHLYENLRDSYPVQGVQAKELHRLAGVPEGPCGLQELGTFQKALSPKYQIVVLTADKPHMNTYKGQENSTRSSRSALSWHEKGFDHDDLARHPCQGRKCTA